MLKKIGVEATYSSNKDDIKNADKLILPGVGAFDHGMKHLHASNLIEILNEEVLVNKKPVLGICLGMQLLLDESEEGSAKGLGWIKGKCVRFAFENNKNLKVPHMGWNAVQHQGQSKLLKSVEDPETRYYFVHSYHAVCENQQHILATTHHGHEFPAIIGREHILGAQFHPEKSHKYGMQFLKNFIEFEAC
jgi:imidazole glycerol-phosphate synthase subunit HisH